eukprot:TRINITY_DN84803_c0_g1_i1.p1 TRINITY_DN84803_c0_g1~~TRINITY_DN84803_c0_g1_i1.p1  ORF type:complete len:186 (-),score=2.26 TRINITY_DN84803_c0_g1_i1:169-699(-)
MPTCDNPRCENEGSLRCSKCKVARYCSQECQRTEWKKHKKQCSQTMKVGGARFPVQHVIDHMINKGSEYSHQFTALTKTEQREVLEGKKEVMSEENQQAAFIKEHYMGTDGKRCDGCKAGRDAGLNVCPRCKYGACFMCQSHHSRGTCYCADSNFGMSYDEINQDGPRKWYNGGYW